jgi:hypothetical protein
MSGHLSENIPEPIVSGFYSAIGDREVVYLGLGSGGTVTIDAADFDLVSAFTWRAHVRTRSNRKTYARTQRRLGKGRRVWVWMHRVIMGLSIESERVVDHYDSDGLNNRRGNLRITLQKQNDRNKRAIHSATGFKGVSTQGKRFRAAITVNGKKRHLGNFDTAEEAGQAYDRAARRLHGSYAATNAEIRGQVAA